MTECPVLTELPENSIIVTADQLKFLVVDTYSRNVGTTVNVRCQTGLVLVGPSSVTCMQSGYWSSDPYCSFPGTTSSPSSGMEESVILVIVLGVVGFLVAALIVFVCVAMYWGRVRRKKNKQYRDSADFYLEDVSSQPYSISRQNRDNAKLYHTDIPQAPPSYSQEQQRQNRRHEPYPLSREREMEEMHSTADYDYDDRHPERRHFRYKCPHCVRRFDEMRHARSLNDILDVTQRENRKEDNDEEMFTRCRRRDGYLWRSRSSFTDMNIPRPYFEVSGLPHYVAYYGGNLPADV